jgi:hypothetical protein
LDVVRSIARSIPKLRADHGAARPPGGQRLSLSSRMIPHFLLLAGLLFRYYA